MTANKKIMFLLTQDLQSPSGIGRYFPLCKDLARQGYDVTMGARPLRRAIERLIGDPITDGILDGDYQVGDTIAIAFDGLELNFVKAGELTKEE